MFWLSISWILSWLYVYGRASCCLKFFLKFFFFFTSHWIIIHPFVLYNTSFFPTKNADKWDPSSPVLCSCSNNYMKYLEILMEYSIWIYQPCAITTQVFSLQNCCHNCIWLDKVNCCFYLQINLSQFWNVKQSLVLLK